MPNGGFCLYTVPHQNHCSLEIVWENGLCHDHNQQWWMTQMPTNSQLTSLVHYHPLVPASAFSFPTFQGLPLSTRVKLFSSHLQEKKQM